MRQFLVFIAAGNLVWEIAQLPLYTIWYERCTGGDSHIAGASVLLALLIAARPAWPHETQSGLLKSEDGGRIWQDAYWLRQPATMVHVTPDGAVYAFVIGTGLVETVEPNLSWQTISKDGFGGDYVLHFAVDPTSHSKLYAISFDPQSKEQAVLASDDAGRTWAPLAKPTN
jgi:photosystem II stability/assembly factor-like uncharacterized protein